ncbi:thioredoxin family protein [Candidatus Saccharibacteria bacterium]|nr:thioredoxin family protein [Candidatus Saccharibacteria bacterium]
MAKERRNLIIGLSVVAGMVLILVAIFVFQGSGSSGEDNSYSGGDGSTSGSGSQDGQGSQGGGDADLALMSKISGQDVMDILALGEASFVYIGRDTCPFCVQFTPRLGAAIRETGATVLYFDIDVDVGSQVRVRALESLGVDGVPHLVFVDRGGVQAVLPLEDTQDTAAIARFLRANQ